MRLLIDTSILIDYLGRKPPFFQDAQRVMAAGYFGDAQLWASTQSFKDAFFVLSHYVDSLQVQDALSKVLEVVNPVDLTADDIATAARLKWDDYENCLIALSAQKAGADYLVTRDRNGFSRSLVAPITPAEWLECIRETERVTYDVVSL